MPPAYEILLLNTAIPQIQAAQAGDTYVVPRDIAFSTVASFAAGAEATPSIVATGDTNTGIWFPAADTVAISTGGTSRLRLDSSGNLGLGVTPSAWNTAGSTKAIQFANDLGAGALAGWFGSVNLLNNAIFSATGGGTMRYVVDGTATQYQQVSGAHTWFTAGAGTAGNAISFTQAMTLDASGNLGVGITSPAARLDVYATSGTLFRCENPGKAQLNIGNGNTSTNYYDADLQIFRSGGGSERARITSGGYFKASNDNGTYTSSTGAYAEFYQSANNAGLLINTVNASFAAEILALRANRNTTNNSFYAIGYYNDAAAEYKLLVADSGDVTNFNGTYGTISDAKMKTDIVDAGSQWSDIKALRFRKFKMKNDPSGLVQLGVVAQEVELTSPGLVDEHADKDAEGNDLGTTTKSVKTSVLLMKAAVALQEAMARIETLEAEVAALKGA